MSSIEGKYTCQPRYNATFYSDGGPYDPTTWTEISFTDHNGNNFESGYIHFFNTDLNNTIQFSFDPRAVDAATKVIHGTVEAGNEFFMEGKAAKSILVRGAATLKLTVWRS